MGSILITQEGVETAIIPEEARDKSVFQFFEMLDNAQRRKDKVYMTSEAYQHKYSYGECYPRFINLLWEEFSSIDSLKGISFLTYQAITSGFGNIFYPSSINDEQEFVQQCLPQGKGGFRSPYIQDDFLCDTSRWQAWHRDHLRDHPDEIDWGQEAWLPNREAVEKILKDEIDRYIEQNYPAQDKEKILKEMLSQCQCDGQKNANAICFHQKVMRSKGRGERMAYIVEVGNKICNENYYTYEEELSRNEEMAVGSRRHIYSIKRDGVKQYISFDFEKGMFELHDDKGVHLGEVMFDGAHNSNAKEDHNLRCIKI